jgi:dTDP-4-amino-4,6-dideoxygalactose transaminase
MVIIIKIGYKESKIAHRTYRIAFCATELQKIIRNNVLKHFDKTFNNATKYAIKNNIKIKIKKETIIEEVDKDTQMNWIAYNIFCDKEQEKYEYADLKRLIKYMKIYIKLLQADLIVKASKK